MEVKPCGIGKLSTKVPSPTSEMEVCDVCHESYGIGDFPWCPHGKPHYSVDAHEPRHEEMLSPSGETFTSARQRFKYMDSHAIVEKDNRFRPSDTARGATGKLLFFDQGSRR